MGSCLASKDPDATLDWVVDYQDWLVLGDSITQSVWTPEDGITVAADSFTTNSTTVTLSGGTAGKIYRVVNRVTTSNGLVDERTLRVVCEQH